MDTISSVVCCIEQTAVHEVGHWLGLRHTFEGGCSATGDRIDDTAPEAIPGTTCAAPRDSCPGDNRTDPIENYMVSDLRLLISLLVKTDTAF
jgi:Pregnancy-associated plasma protein-A